MRQRERRLAPAKKPVYRIAVTEALRIATLLGVSDEIGPPPANMVAVEADGKVSLESPAPWVGPEADDDDVDSSITWLVPPGERIRKPPSG